MEAVNGLSRDLKIGKPGGQQQTVKVDIPAGVYQLCYHAFLLHCGTSVCVVQAQGSVHPHAICHRHLMHGCSETSLQAALLCHFSG